MNFALPKWDVSGLRVGSWPGASHDTNTFVEIFCKALERQGCEVVDVKDLRYVDPEDVDVLHIHWPDQIFWGRRLPHAIASGLVMLTALDRLRRAGVRIVWTVHNLQPHDAGRAKLRVWRWFSRAVARLTDGYTTLSPATLPIAARQFPFPQGAPSTAHHHPRYPVPAVLKQRCEEKRRWQVPPDPVHLVFVGAVRRYKGITEFAETLSTLPPGQFVLTVAGPCAAELRPSFERLASDHANIRFHDRFLDDEAFVSAVRAADYVVLPFNRVLHSGSIVHALSLGRAVITPRTPYAQELAKVVGCDWLRLYDPPLTSGLLAQLLAPPEGEPDLRALSPETFGANLARFYRGLVRTSAVTTKEHAPDRRRAIRPTVA